MNKRKNLTNVKTDKNEYPKTRGGLWILIVAAVVLEAIACIQYVTSHRTIREEASERAKSELRRAELVIEKHTIEMETAAKTLAMLAEKYVDCPDSIYSATRMVVGAIRNTSSLAVAYVPGYFPKQGTYFEVCSSRISDDSIYTRQIGSAEHDYTQLEWYKNGFLYDGCRWCEPYLDDSGSQAWVVSCSCPVHGRNGEVVAVVCVDLSLDYLHQLSEYLQIYEGSHYCITSAQGQDIVAKPDTIAGRKYEHFDRVIDATGGWVISIIIPDNVIYAELRRVGIVVLITMLFGLVVLVFIIYRTGKNLINLVNLSNQKERMESELSIARNIQMAMLPTRFPPFPDYPNLNASGVVIPAKEVGGDLFDFYLRENKLFFCIGDVSGKGVPASLVMAVTRSLFRSFTSYMDSPSQIVMQMNDSLSGESNDQNMFVTLLLGILDVSTGELRYCNAGHDAPVHLTFGHLPFDFLNCMPNLPLGVLSGFTYTEQSVQMEAGDTLFLYTDGLSEAENSNKELFGKERMMQTIRQWNAEMTAEQQVKAMHEAVAAYVGDAEQSDDLTMFTIRLLSLSPQEGLSAMSNQSTRSSLVMRNDIQQIPTLAEWIDTLGLPDELNMPINLALEETVTNVMLYAYPGKSGRVLVEAETSPHQVVFTISDSGIAFDPTQQKEPDITQGVEDRPIGGLGIFLVRQIMDDIHYERKDDKNILTLIKKLNR